MKIASIADVKARFSAYLKELGTGPVVITRNGRPAGVLLAVEDEDEIERLILAYTPRLRAILEAAHRGSQPAQPVAQQRSRGNVKAKRSDSPGPDRPAPGRRGAEKA